jgi:hypothetical protein
MNRQPADERRRHLRCAFSSNFRGTALSSAGGTDPSRETVHGRIQDFSEGGLSVIADRKLNQFEVIRGEIMLPNMSIGVPSLLQVRWVRPTTKKSHYRAGLQFLL